MIVLKPAAESRFSVCGVLAQPKTMATSAMVRGGDRRDDLNTQSGSLVPAVSELVFFLFAQRVSPDQRETTPTAQW
jgi:hypothetical protein